MNGIMNETRLTAKDAAKHPEIVEIFGREITPGTIHRWAKTGIKHDRYVVRLEVAQVGGKNWTSLEAIMRFFERCGEARQRALDDRDMHRGSVPLMTHEEAVAELDRKLNRC